VVPRIEAAEPLGLELADFANAIRTGEEPRSNSRLGLEIVRAIEAAHLSMARCGDPVELLPAGHRAADRGGGVPRRRISDRVPSRPTRIAAAAAQPAS
jgi:hypothetical protein